MWGWPIIEDKVENEKVTIPEDKHNPMDTQAMRITIQWWQIKSFNKAKKVAEALSTIEEEMWIGSTSIVMEWVFFCPDTDFSGLDNTAMEIYLRKFSEDSIEIMVKE